MTDAPPAWLSGRRGDGVIARVTTPAMARAIVRCGVPTVDVRLDYPELNLHSVVIDNVESTRVALEYLLSLRLRHYAFCGYPHGANRRADVRETAFVRGLAERGYGCNRFDARSTAGRSWNWERRRMIRWLRALPKPIGILAANDDRGLEVLEACRENGIAVPRDIAVMGFDNDEYICDFSQPKLTSVDVGAERVGYEAARLLARVMSRPRVKPHRLLLPPLGVVARASTQIVHCDDPALATLIRTLHNEACSGKTVDELLSNQPLSRSTLHRRFLAWCGRSPKEEILRLRCERAKRLLIETDHAIGRIAAECGFSHMKHLARVFRDHEHQSPGEYRRKMKPGRRS